MPLNSVLWKKKRNISQAKSFLCEMGLGIRLSTGLREIESFPLHRFKVDFRVVEFIYHIIFEKLSNKNFTRT